MTGFENALTEGMKPQLTRNVETGNQPEIAARFQSPSPFALLCRYSLCQESPPCSFTLHPHRNIHHTLRQIDPSSHIALRIIHP